MDETLVDAVHGRFVRYAETGWADASLVLCDEAADQAGELWKAAVEEPPEGVVPFKVINALAWLHWCRYYALPEGQDRDELQVSTALFAHLYRIDPELVPEELRDVFEAGDDHAMEDSVGIPALFPSSYVGKRYPSARIRAVADGPDWWEQRAAAVLREAGTEPPTGVFDEAIELLREAYREYSDVDDRKRCGSVLAGVLRRHFERTGQRDDLDEADSIDPDPVQRMMLLHFAEDALEFHTTRFGPRPPEWDKLEADLRNVPMPSAKKPDVNGFREGQRVRLRTDFHGGVAAYPAGQEGTVLITDTSPAHIRLVRESDLHEVLMDDGRIIVIGGALLEKMKGRTQVVYSANGGQVQVIRG
jgi:hypothetical protein